MKESGNKFNSSNDVRLISETPRVLLSNGFFLSMLYHFLDTSLSFSQIVKRLSLNVIANGSVRALCGGFTSRDLIIKKGC